MADESFEPLVHTVPLRISTQDKRRITRAANRLHLSNLDTMRLAQGIGLEVLKAIDYDLYGTIANRFLREATGPVKRRRRKRFTPNQ
jgi:hypothetical protein